MTHHSAFILSSRRLAILALASALGFPVLAQQAPASGDLQNTPPSVAQQQPSPEAAPSVTAAREGFWGRVNPFARKIWVKRQTDPIRGQLIELDQVNAQNARDIKDVDGRAQAGIHQAQSTADAAGQSATAAGLRAQTAHGIAQGAVGHVDQLNSTINGLDTYNQISEAKLEFPRGLPVLSTDDRKQLDRLAASVVGHQGYIVEIEAHSPHAGSTDIQSSERLAEAVKRYLVTEHQIPVYRLHSVALGNAQAAAAGEEATQPVRSSSVLVRLMENSLAAQAVVSPHDAAASSGAERP